MKYSGWPEPGELVVGDVDEIADFGVFVDLDEYEDKRGLCHISEVASGWIKNVRDHVREGQTVVAKVLEVDESSNQIDLSIKDVNEHQRKETIQDWKNAQKADNWMEIALGEDVDDDRYTSVANALLAEYESLYDAFEAAAIRGDEALDDVDVDADTVDAVVAAARDNVSVPYVDVTGYVDLESAAPDGVDDVRDALAAAEGNGEVPDGVDLDVGYVGSPEYRIKVRAPDYKTAESQLEAAAERAREAIEAAGGEGEFHRERREDDE
ncbi:MULTISPECIES: translation initiation factor IF-2 subunit alpha [Halorubrum]|uniref:Translation initiation factor 2 subunit alpha n=1 Tax=Halorubrum tropicale TaxID=1765655 RepID=A0A0M9AT63_9EURY|nr:MULTISPECIES: translation initiation factor IF-2 subunit alpha [Halorubrum]KOX97011.1 translation initiation factor IF-2 subunit alpha [Halorubrum tropicale]TKX46140.1 translation initiation factor IF-2 subunit alpha [Halorubrum sp. ARQ200]TKX50019.1 translation initiation factor IF-2 subunit alpha [Halorubrum sp. ASP121]TKX61526.1 translation initiation factor IF-2 subunit alpha [Halorubrum sp. ASP1]